MGVLKPMVIYESSIGNYFT